MSVEERLHELGIELPEPPPPAGNYIGAVSVEILKLIDQNELVPWDKFDVIGEPAIGSIYTVIKIHRVIVV